MARGLTKKEGADSFNAILALWQDPPPPHPVDDIYRINQAWRLGIKLD